MSVIIGLTGLIGTGKSTVAKLLMRLGVPVHDADSCVHALYRDPRFQKRLLAEFPFARTFMGRLDRNKLLHGLRDKPELKQRLEAIVHPLVLADQQKFVRLNRRARTLVLDVPLLFEAGMDASCDEVWVTKTRPALQRARVLKRPGFDAAKLATILRWQGPAKAKERLADWVLNTARSRASLVWRIKKRLRLNHARNRS